MRYLSMHGLKLYSTETSKKRPTVSIQTLPRRALGLNCNSLAITCVLNWVLSLIDGTAADQLLYRQNTVCRSHGPVEHLLVKTCAREPVSCTASTPNCDYLVDCAKHVEIDIIQHSSTNVDDYVLICSAGP
jgi:hypothetical protein